MMKGFTLIEVILVLALIAIITVGGLTLDQIGGSRRGAQAAGQTTASALRNAQVRSRAMVGDDAWSVRISSRSAAVFRGASFDGRDISEDRILEFAEPVSVSGGTDVVFTKGAWAPQEAASVSLAIDDDLWHVRVNGEGAISYGMD